MPPPCRQGNKRNPYELSVSHSTGNRWLEQAALEQVAKWPFAPATLNGKPVDAGDHVKMEFRLANIKRGTSQPGTKFRLTQT